MQRLKIKTQRKRQIVDITDRIQSALQKQSAATGLCQLTVLHTTAALTSTDLDMLDAFEALIPKLHYRHPHNPAHVPDHILSTLIGTSLTQPVDSGELVLGTWQRIILVELDGPREREVVLTFVAEE